MIRTFIVAVLAFLVLASAANARLPVDQPVQPEQTTDQRSEAPTSSLAGTTDETTAAFAQEEYYKSQGDALAALATEPKSTSGVATADSDDTPWAIIGLGLAGGALVAGGVVVAVRRTRPRERVAA